jgi:hypothetical protein
MEQGSGKNASLLLSFRLPTFTEQYDKILHSLVNRYLDGRRGASELVR